MRLYHTLARISTVLDDPNLVVASAGLVPVMGLAERAGLEVLTQRHLGLPGDKGANAGLKVSSLVAGMVAARIYRRHGDASAWWDGQGVRPDLPPSTLRSFLRAFTFGRLRQLDAVAARFLHALAGITSLLSPQQIAHGDGERRGYVFVDVDNTVVEVHGHPFHGAGFGYNKVRGLNALLATVHDARGQHQVRSVAQRLRRRRLRLRARRERLVADAIKTRPRRLLPNAQVLVRMDSAFCGRNPVHAVLADGV